MTGEALLDMAVELAGAPPLPGEPGLRPRADDAHDDAGEGQGHERDEGQLPGDREHHDRDADDGQRGVHELGQCLLERLLDVVDVVRRPRQDVAALPGVEVAQRQAVELALDLRAEGVDDVHRHPVEQQPLHPHEDGRGEVHGEHDGDDGAERAEVHALPRDGAGRPGHRRHVLTGGVVPPGDPGDDDVHRVADETRGEDVEGDVADDEHDDERERQARGGEQAGEAQRRRPERPGGARGRAAGGVGADEALELRDLVVADRGVQVGAVGTVGASGTVGAPGAAVGGTAGDAAEPGLRHGPPPGTPRWPGTSVTWRAGRRASPRRRPGRRP